MNIAERGAYWGRWRPDAVAVKIDGKETTFGEWADRIPRIAGALAARGIQPGDRVGVLGMNSVEWCELALGALHAGAVVVPLNIRFAPPELSYVLDHSGCRAVGYDSAFAELFARANENAQSEALRISLDGAADADVTHGELRSPDCRPGCVVRGASDPAVIGYTGGTTGFPKGATLTHGNIAAMALQYALAEGATINRRTILPIPLAFTGGVVNNFLGTYAVGGALILEREFVPERILQLLVAERITSMIGVPIMWQEVAAVDGFAEADLSTLETAICGGSPVSQELLETFLAKDVLIRQAYALTESSGSACVLPKAYALSKKKTAGVPNAHTEIRLVADDGAEINEPGVIGEILVRGPQVMSHYWEDQNATAEALRDGWLFTGDLGCFDADRFLRVVDRKKAMFVSGGLNVYPVEIERVVEAFPGVAECAAFGLPHERYGEASALVVRGTNGPLDVDALLARCREQLADYKVPRTVIQTGQLLPRSGLGKLLRNELSARYGPSLPPTRLATGSQSFARPPWTRSPR